MSVPANFFDTYDITASPADSAETVIAILGGVGELVPGSAVHLSARVNVQMATDAGIQTLRVRKNSLTGDQVGADWVANVVPTGTFDEGTFDIEVVDFPGDFAGAVYVLTYTSNSASSGTSVIALGFHARTN